MKLPDFFRPIKDENVPFVIERWRKFFGITHRISSERISPHQVTGEMGHAGCCLVGVVYDSEQAVIYHTRYLTVEDIVHELIHVANPDWSEADVVSETARIAERYQAVRAMSRRRGRPETIIVRTEVGQAVPALA